MRYASTWKLFERTVMFGLRHCGDHARIRRCWDDSISTGSVRYVSGMAAGMAIVLGAGGQVRVENFDADPAVKLDLTAYNGTLKL